MEVLLGGVVVDELTKSTVLASKKDRDKKAQQKMARRPFQIQLT